LGRKKKGGKKKGDTRRDSGPERNKLPSGCIEADDASERTKKRRGEFGSGETGEKESKSKKTSKIGCQVTKGQKAARVQETKEKTSVTNLWEYLEADCKGEKKKLIKKNTTGCQTSLDGKREGSKKKKFNAEKGNQGLGPET